VISSMNFVRKLPLLHLRQRLPLSAVLGAQVAPRASGTTKRRA